MMKVLKFVGGLRMMGAGGRSLKADGCRRVTDAVAPLHHHHHHLIKQ